MKKLSESLPRESKIEFEKYWTKIILEFLWWVWDKEKWVSLTGSATKLTIIKPDWEKIVGLIDFWMFQWCEKELEYNEILPFDLKEINFSIATHTHLDHIWKLLHLSKDEFNWTIWTTRINKEVLPVMLADIIKLQPDNPVNKIENLKESIKNLEKTRQKLASSLWEKNDAVQQLDDFIDQEKEKLKKLMKVEKENKKEYFERQDSIKLMEKINGINYYEKVEVSNDIQLSFIKAWHLPGSAQAILKIKAGKNKYITIWFSWDIWKFKNPAVWGKPDITKEKLDLFIIESTYAGRYHLDFKEEGNRLIEEINKTIKKWWKIIIPAFMQWRAQEFALYLSQLIRLWKIKKVPMFYHSKSIEKILDIYKRHYPSQFWILKKSIKSAVNGVWKNKELSFESTKWAAILIASWWMMEWWTINNYFTYLQDPKNLFISSGFQAEWTKWNQVFIKWTNEIEIPGIGIININCNLHNFRWFSGHWDQEDLLTLIKWISFSKDAKVIINHWEKSPEQITFWYAIKWIIWRTKEVLFADFNEKTYEK